MVICFSGTGNSRYIAKNIADGLGDELIDATYSVNEEIVLYCGENTDTYIFVCPTYAWRIPRVFENHIEKATFVNESGKPLNAYFVLTCGGDIGNAEKYIKSLCKKKGFNLLGVAEAVMPENYIAMFSVPSEKTSEKIIAKANERLPELIGKIKNRLPLEGKKTSFIDKRKSDIVNLTFYPFCVSARKFYTTDKCISCGKCERVCPLDNIKLVNGKPKWGKECTHCMACIGICPTEAIEYGNSSKGKRRYYLGDAYNNKN